jgi:hypothetical protein
LNKLVACFGFRYEPQWLVDDLLKNIEGVADDVFTFDNRDCKDLWIDRETFNNTLREGARSLGADYMLVLAPDERLEKNAGAIIKQLVNRNSRKSYRFKLREMYTPTAYRIDGIWGKKGRVRLHYMHGAIGNENVDLNIYHLKHIEPENRISRAEIHKATNTADNRERGFDYLADETGMVLKEIPIGREFYPPYSRPYIFSTNQEANL